MVDLIQPWHAFLYSIIPRWPETIFFAHRRVLHVWRGSLYLYLYSQRNVNQASPFLKKFNPPFFSSDTMVNGVKSTYTNCHSSDHRYGIVSAKCQLFYFCYNIYLMWSYHSELFVQIKKIIRYIRSRIKSISPLRYFLEVIPYLIFMKFSALNAEINIVSSSYNFISTFPWELI
jgi:hypothetical protein